jgi:hypothetical protein
MPEMKDEVLKVGASFGTTDLNLDWNVMSELPKPETTDSR